VDLSNLTPVGKEASPSTKHMFPTSASQAGTITKYELLNYFGSRRFFVLLIIAILISGLLTIVAAFEGVSSFGSTAAAFYNTWYVGGYIPTYVVIFCAIFFGGDAISGEFQNKSGYFLVAKPVSRSVIYAGKYLGALIASLAIVGVFEALTFANGVYYFGLIVPTQFSESIAFTLVWLVASLGLTFFFSSLFKTSTFSLLVSSMLLFFGFFIISALLSGKAGIEPWFVLTYGSDIIGNALNPSGYPAHIITKGATTTFNATISEGLAIMTVYFVVTTLAGLIVFERKEFS
jgi:ABC-type transport system involved in multi-copper enzyme maturation permease subunit